MAWRIHEHVLRGKIDNRTRGRVTGRIWLAGSAAPLVLDPRGDCHPDLAGCFLSFENPQSVPLTTRPPAIIQRGTAGDITAARKVRVFVNARQPGDALEFEFEGIETAPGKYFPRLKLKILPEHDATSTGHRVLIGYFMVGGLPTASQP